MYTDLTIYHPDGTPLLAASAAQHTPYAITNATQKTGLNGIDTLELTIQSTQPLPLQIGDQIHPYGDTYTLLLLPKITKTAQRLYQYQCTFEGLHYLLLNTLFLLPFSVSNSSYVGNLSDWAERIIENLQRTHPQQQWTTGTIMPNTTEQLLTLQDTNCLDALQQICTLYDCEFAITHRLNSDQYTLHLPQRVGQTIDYPFAYGQQGGLSQITDDGTDDPDFATRIYFYGGTTNIPTDYFNQRQSNRLCLHQGRDDSQAIDSPTSNQSFIQMSPAINNYGFTEAVHTFPDIYPNRIGTVTAIDPNDILSFFDDTTDFDLNARDGQGNTLYLIPNTAARIHFNTGLLAGYDFDIRENGYNHATHKFTINKFTDENGYEFPAQFNNAFRINVGDQYIITDIIMPQSYIDQAEQQLQEAAQQWYEEHSAPEHQYTLAIEQNFCRRLVKQLAITDNKPFHVGDNITLTDTPLNINIQARIITLQRDLLQDYAYTLTIALTNTIRARYNWNISHEQTPNQIGIITATEYLRRNQLNTMRNNQMEQDSTVSRISNTLLEQVKQVTQLDSTQKSLAELQATQAQKIIDFDEQFIDISNAVRTSNATVELHSTQISGITQQLQALSQQLQELELRTQQNPS